MLHAGKLATVVDVGAVEGVVDPLPGGDVVDDDVVEAADEPGALELVPAFASRDEQAPNRRATRRTAAARAATGCAVPDRSAVVISPRRLGKAVRSSSAGGA
ncbi:MAG: hypothetical protein ACRD0Z_01045 [Acidimicrobiales bacterium]